MSESTSGQSGWRWFWYGVGALATVRISLLLGQRVALLPWQWADDSLFVRQAINLIDGSWLGSYDELTLVKGPGYPLFLAGNFLLGLPLHLTLGVLYTLGVVLLCLALRPLIRRPSILLFLFAILEFEPMIFSSGTMRVVREPLYASLTLMIFAGAIALFLRAERLDRPIGWWTLLCGSSVGMAWITREEGIWYVPALALLAFFLLIRVRARFSESGMIRRYVSCVGLPVAIAVGVVGWVACSNWMRYGVFLVNDQSAGSFPKALETIQSLTHPDVSPRVPVPKALRQELYRVSPRFRELEPTLETKKWYRAGCRLPGYSCDELNSGWFSWAVRDAAAAAGHFESARTAEAFFHELHTEVENACAGGRLVCGPRGSGLMPPLTKWNWRNTKPALQQFANVFLKYGFVHATSPNVKTSGSLSAVGAMAAATNLPGEALAVLDDPVELGQATNLNTAKVRVLERIRSAYLVAAPAMAGLTAITLLWMMVRWWRKQLGADDLTFLAVMAALGAAILSRMAIIFSVDMSAFPAIHGAYWSAGQPLFLTIGVVGGSWMLLQVARLRGHHGVAPTSAHWGSADQTRAGGMQTSPLPPS